MESLWTWLNTPTSLPDVLDAFGLVSAAVFAVGFVASAYLAGPGGDGVAGGKTRAVAIKHWANVGLWTFGPGLFFFTIRALQINPLSFAEPIWLVGCLIALIIAAARFAAWRRTATGANANPQPHPVSASNHPPLPSQWERGAGG